MTLTSEVAERKWFGYRVRVVSWLRDMGWLREGEQLPRDLDQPMRDAFLAGFESGAKWGIQNREPNLGSEYQLVEEKSL